MTDKPGLVDAIEEAVWQLGIAAAATGNAALLSAAEKLSAAHRSRVVVAWWCRECEWVDTADTTDGCDCRAAVRPLVEGE